MLVHCLRCHSRHKLTRKIVALLARADLQTDPNEEVNLAAVKRTPEQEKEYQRLKKKLRDVQRTRLGPIPGFQQEVNITANTATKKTNGLEILDEGFTLGVPVAAGNITLNWVLDPKTSVADTKITIATEEGIIRGKASTTYTVNKSANSIKFVGTMNITSGTSAFRGIKATGLEFTDDNTLNGQNGKVTIKGVAHYV